MSNFETEKTSVIKNLRACLISAQDGVPVHNITRDYYQLIGEAIPFQRLGYRNIEDFLKTIPDISVQSRGGIYYVQAKANDSTAGLISLVRGQKRSIPRKRKPNRNLVHIRQSRPPRYRRRPTLPAAPQWPAMKINVPQKMNNLPTRTVSFKQEKNYPTVDENRNVRNETPQIIKKPAQPSQLQLQPQSHPQPTINRLKQYLDTAEFKTGLPNSLIHAQNNPTPVLLKHSVSLDSSSPPPLSKLNSRLQKNKSSPDVKSNPDVNPESKLSFRLKQASQGKTVNDGTEVPNTKSVTFAVPTTPTKTSLGTQLPKPSTKQSAQSRLEKTRIPPESKLVVVVDTQEGNKTCFYQSKLSAYVQDKNWAKEPSYVVYKQKSGKRQESVCFACTVRVAIPRQSFRLPEEIFELSTFPIDFLTQAESKEHAAFLALEKLQEREELLHAPIENNPTIIIERIKMFLENKDCGIWAQKIEDEYKSTFEQLLPTYWVDIIKVSEQLEIEELGPSYIVRLREESTNPSPVRVSMPELTYPTGTTWDVFITAGRSVSNVNLRFIGDEYSTRFDMFNSGMESWYENRNNQFKPRFAVGEYCAAYYGKSWWRVIITNLDGEYVRIQFIDHGDEEKIHRSNLFELGQQFFSLPPQAVSVSLKGLEEFANRRESEDFFNKTIIGKSLVAVVESFQPKTISLTLYDTSNEEAVNLNDSLRHLFELNYKNSPQLEVNSVYEMSVTNIEPDGTVYVQIFNDGLELLHELIDFYEDIEFESVKDYSQVYMDRVYLAYQQEDNLYYRVKPLNTARLDNKVQVYCLDYGKSCSVFLEDLIYMEEDSSYLLDKVPGQAIRIQLDEIPPAVFTASIKNKLINYLSGENSSVIVGRVKNIKDGIPIVELFRRTVPDNLLVSINQTLVVEENINLTSKNLERLNLTSESVLPPLLPPVQIPTTVIKPVIKPKNTTEIMTKILTVYPVGAIERILAQNRPELPEIDDYFNIFVHSTASPSHFLINPSDYVSSLNKVMDEMNSYYNANSIQTILEEGSLCAAKDGNFWYRAYIDKVIDLENISVKVLDYGCVKIISALNVKPLLDIFTKHPYIGFSAKIHGIVPAHGDWSVEDTITMKNIINKKTIRAKMKDIIPNKQGLGGMTLSLELHATDNTGQEFHVAEHFVRQYNARFE